MAASIVLLMLVVILEAVGFCGSPLGGLSRLLLGNYWVIPGYSHDYYVGQQEWAVNSNYLVDSNIFL